MIGIREKISWNFNSSPLLNGCKTLEESFIKWANKRLLELFNLHNHEERINELFILAYQVQTDFVKDIALQDISILDDELIKTNLDSKNPNSPQNINQFKKNVVVQQLISYFVGCSFGRYRLNDGGLKIAYVKSLQEDKESYRFNDKLFEIDNDSIVPMLDANSPFNDNIIERFKYFLQIVWGEETLTENINFVNTSLGMDIEKYLTEKFWDFHKKMYQKKPIYWLFTSPEGSFKVLTYMHRMDKFTVQKIRLNYLMRYIDFLRDKIQQAETTNEQGRTIDKLRKALADCLEYDKILKPLADQQITFDLDDGVTVNYEKFKGAVASLR